MSAVPKPDYESRFSSRSNLHVVADVPDSLFDGNRALQPQRPLRSRRSVVQSLPQPRSQPLWLSALIKLQQGTTVAAWGLGTAVLALYGWTVYSQQAWNQTYDRLDRLQRSEEQMLTAIEGLKDQVAKQAETSAETQLAKPSMTIPLQPAPQRSAAETAASSSPAPAASPSTLGY
jgi:hypothetical protein